MKMNLLILGASLLALQLTITAGEPADYVAHEWGTFTSVQGADGVQLEWNPLLLTELPAFVHDRTHPNGKPDLAVLLSKTGIVARQRLETPVIYFYSKKERTVDVSVKFPQGTVTEWYPQENPVPRGIVKAGQSAARWQKLRILADGKKTALPTDARGSHYFAAREVAANFVKIETPDAKAETEKFLFYRGVGAFEAPLKVALEGTDATELRLTNNGGEPFDAMYAVNVRSGKLAFAPVGKMAARESMVVQIPVAAQGADQSADLARELRGSLENAGLRVDEAAAMVKTWEKSWLAEPGVRVLYVLPRAWTDRTLPLTLAPAPREIARVMVGRAEVLLPPVERALQTQIEHFQKGDEAAKADAIAAARALDLGRFAEPAVRHLCLADPKNREFSNAAWELLNAAYAPKPAATETAAR